MKPSKFILPLVLTLGLFAAYLVLANQPGLLGRFAPSQELIFGKDLSYLQFLAFTALIFLVVRIFDALLFGAILPARRIEAPLLLRQIVSVSLFLLLFGAVFAGIFGQSLISLLTAGTVVAAVIGLALQDTLGNLFSGIALHVERTFEVGDVVRSGDLIGVVESVNWRATRLRTFNNSVLVVPNSVISKERLEIHQKNELNARLVRVGVGYHVPPAKVIPVLQQAATNVEDVSRVIPCVARVADFGDSAVIYELKYWTRNYQRRDAIDAEIRRAMWYALKRNGITIPFPIRTLQRYSEPPVEELISREKVTERLRKVEILSPLSDEERTVIAMEAQVHTYARGETILRLGEEGDSMFVIHEGEVAVLLPGAEGAEEVARLQSGSVFGEMALLTGEPRAADVVALTDVKTLEITKNSLQPVLLNNPDLAGAISEKISERRDQSAALRSRTSIVDDRKSVLTKIRWYFGL